jgi:galactose-1-phosphate uridylyltransferase
VAVQLLVLDEVVLMLKAAGAPNRVIDAFRKQAEAILAARNVREVEASNDEEPDKLDRITVSSSYGHRTQKGYVEFTMNEQRTQMEPKKAREVGLMLLESAEAAIGDEIVVKLLKDKVGLDTERAGMVLIDLREIRQGTRGIAWPS